MPMNKVVLKIELFSIEDKGATPTHFGFMSFNQVETYIS